MPFRKIDHEQAITLREFGWSIAQLAAYFNCTRAAVYRHFAIDPQWGDKTKEQSVKAAASQVKALRAEGMPFSQIGNTLGISKGRAHQLSTL